MGRSRYVQDDYISQARLHSYAHQLGAIIEAEPESVLEVGVGSGYVQQALTLLGYRVATLDIRPENEPDLLGSVAAIPAEDGSYDVVSCCQVLEHLPFDELGRSLTELARVARRRVVVSLPDVTRSVDVRVRLPRVGTRSWQLNAGFRPVPMPADRSKIGHQWEIGYRGFPLGLVRRTMTDVGLTIERTWRVPENPYHRFFVLTPGPRARRS